jgi:hypothetical protein
MRVFNPSGKRNTTIKFDFDLPSVATEAYVIWIDVAETVFKKTTKQLSSGSASIDPCSKRFHIGSNGVFFKKK